MSNINTYTFSEETNKKFKMGVNEDDVMNIMGGMEHAGGIKLNDHKRKLKNRYSFYFI